MLLNFTTTAIDFNVLFAATRKPQKPKNSSPEWTDLQRTFDALQVGGISDHVSLLANSENESVHQSVASKLIKRLKVKSEQRHKERELDTILNDIVESYMIPPNPDPSTPDPSPLENPPVDLDQKQRKLFTDCTTYNSHIIALTSKTGDTVNLSAKSSFFSFSPIKSNPDTTKRSIFRESNAKRNIFLKPGDMELFIKPNSGVKLIEDENLELVDDTKPQTIKGTIKTFHKFSAMFKSAGLDKRIDKRIDNGILKPRKIYPTESIDDIIYINNQERKEIADMEFGPKLSTRKLHRIKSFKFGVNRMFSTKRT